MNDLNKQAIEAPINAQGIEEFNRQVEAALLQLRGVTDAIFQVDGRQPVAIALAAALLASEVAAWSGSSSGRSPADVMDLLDSLLSDMQNHAKRSYESYQEQQAVFEASTAEDVAFREVAANDA